MTGKIPFVLVGASSDDIITLGSVGARVFLSIKLCIVSSARGHHSVAESDCDPCQLGGMSSCHHPSRDNVSLCNLKT